MNWKNKLAAYLHDPPSKCLDIQTHGERSEAAFRQAGFTDTEIGDYFKEADHTAAAADRFPFPKSKAAGLTCAFDGVRNAFHHPLSGQCLPFHAEFKSVAQGVEGEQSVQPALSASSLAVLPDDDARWRARFFSHWRLWPQFAREKDYRLALLPADTRIPDHTIWTHMQVVSALAGCTAPNKVLRPAFLKFQLGPVQEFIAASRSIRDLWSGSYLLSWLMAAGLKAFSQKAGPDAVIFPNLQRQPLFDLHWRRELWDQVRISNDQTVWESLGWKETDLLTPNLPNVFLAIVSADQATALAKTVCDSVRSEWALIAGTVWTKCKDAGLTKDENGISETARKNRFDSQVAKFLSLSWSVTHWPETIEAALKVADNFQDQMPVVEARKRVQAVVDLAEKKIPFSHRDRRYYTDDTKAKLNNIGLGWSILVALNAWELDAVRQTRVFEAANTGGWSVGTFSNKDSLNGRDEAVAGGKAWGDRARALSAGPWASLFKHDDWLGATALIKRVWHFAYLADEPWNLKTSSKTFPMPDTRSIARHEPFGRDDSPENATAMDQDPSEKYFAVLALDGDEIGKWVSGQKTPCIKKQLAAYQDGSGNPDGAMAYFTSNADPDAGGTLLQRYKEFLESARPLSPSYHLQFSESLSNFALYCARPIVEVFDGRLIYAGGDDVLALLPADAALDCAHALRMGFQGDPQLKEYLRDRAISLQNFHDRKQKSNAEAAGSLRFQQAASEGTLLGAQAPGFLSRLEDVSLDQQKKPIPFLVPGPAADCSVGVAIAHFKAPLQDVVRAAQAAEKRAKRSSEQGGLGRSAVAVSLFKRSGEIIEWGCQWESGGLAAYKRMLEALQDNVVSAKFPHRIIELVEPYCSGQFGQRGGMQSFSDFETKMLQILQNDIGTAAERQRGKNYSYPEVAKIQQALEQYLAKIDGTSARVAALIGLCQTVAFIARNLPEQVSPTASDQSATQVSADQQNP
ncbi:MAG: type III-B CRISPR-associated protein Cas10/Cmr2 [Verrucomicrobia bacterium]|jgi:CRISPR-associated protein Cas10/Cmr2 subtype III-B|nr:type III-B CRISPR-associated protein Cas10/Cmr2 [Verrucomicrobiota bacterium]